MNNPFSGNNTLGKLQMLSFMALRVIEWIIYALLFPLFGKLNVSHKLGGWTQGG